MFYEPWHVCSYYCSRLLLHEVFITLRWVLMFLYCFGRLAAVSHQIAVAFFINHRLTGRRRLQIPPRILTVMHGIIKQMFSALTATLAKLDCWTTSGGIGRRWLLSTLFFSYSSSLCTPSDAVLLGTTEGTTMLTLLDGSTLNLENSCS